MQSKKGSITDTTRAEHGTTYMGAQEKIIRDPIYLARTLRHMYFVHDVPYNADSYETQCAAQRRSRNSPRRIRRQNYLALQLPDLSERYPRRRPFSRPPG